MRFFRNLARALSLALPFISPSLAHAHAHQGRRHHVHRQADLARRDPGEVNLYKRQFNNARFTYYAVGLGACGVTNVPSDFVRVFHSWVLHPYSPSLDRRTQLSCTFSLLYIGRHV